MLLHKSEARKKERKERKESGAEVKAIDCIQNSGQGGAGLKIASVNAPPMEKAELTDEADCHRTK